MNCLNSSLSKDGAEAKAMAGVEVGVCYTTGVGVGVPLLLLRAAPASLFSPAGGGF